MLVFEGKEEIYHVLNLNSDESIGGNPIRGCSPFSGE